MEPADFRFEPKQLWFGLRVHCQTWDFMGEAHWGKAMAAMRSTVLMTPPMGNFMAHSKD